jgi:hypothetical protein
MVIVFQHMITQMVIPVDALHNMVTPLGGMVVVGQGTILLEVDIKTDHIGQVQVGIIIIMVLHFYHLQIYNIMETILKDMRLKINKLNDTQYKIVIEDLNGNEIWNGGEQYYIYDDVVVMSNDNLLELIEQMKGVPFWNIVEVINNLYL